MKHTEKHPLAAERRKHLKEAASLPLDKRITYYLNYFKGWLIGIPLALILSFVFVKAFFFGPESVLYGYFVNAPGTMHVEEDVFLEDFISYAGIDSPKEKVYFNSTFSLENAEPAELSKLLSALTLGEIDFFICEETAYEELALGGLLTDLDAWLTPEEKALYNDRLVRFITADRDSSVEPSLCEGKLVAIDVTDSLRLQESGAYEGAARIYFCIAVNAPHKENTLHFLEWILQNP